MDVINCRNLKITCSGNISDPIYLGKIIDDKVSSLFSKRGRIIDYNKYFFYNKKTNSFICFFESLNKTSNSVRLTKLQQLKSDLENNTNCVIEMGFFKKEEILKDIFFLNKSDYVNTEFPK